MQRRASSWPGAAKASRRAGVQAGGAGAAVARRVRRVGVQLQIERAGAEEEIAAQALVEQHGVLAEPAQAGSAGEIAFQQRGRVDHAAAATAGRLAAQPGQQAIQPLAENIVVVPAARVTARRGAVAARVQCKSRPGL